MPTKKQKFYNIKIEGTWEEADTLNELLEKVAARVNGYHVSIPIIVAHELQGDIWIWHPDYSPDSLRKTCREMGDA